MSENEHGDPESPQAGDRQWVPVPPANPYATRRPSSTGRGLSIAAMGLGLLALLTSAVSAFYFNPLVALGAGLGILAAVLGIVALVRRGQLRAAAITGVGAAAVAVLIALLSGVLALGTALGTGVAELAPGTGDSPGAEETVPPESEESAIEWPANMASGGIVFAEGGEPVRSDPVPSGTAPQPTRVERESGRNDVLVYVDYRCPHCAAFELANGDLLEEALGDGSTTVELVPLSFLDRGNEGGYSARAAAAVVCTVDIQPEHAWELHAALLDPAVQPSPGEDVDDAGLIALAAQASGADLDPGVADCIESGRFVPFVKALNDWALANPVPNAIDQESRLSGTPTVLVNGVLYTGAPDDAAAFREFYDEQTS
ncbi:thioredoxin domain-containing protein [Leucobacter weissii]|uniref:Thioredoxin domain-containing protein n=1 Tax=Leucobacter weissii TaxID=1983706 RepID=A0A939SAS7_9MICO|nr:thioredoxin domain-containing protein [Leucobacter weissii]MBO1900775.1 thioredoxin domain-containing protein [Leucobacter weissii]